MPGSRVEKGERRVRRYCGPESTLFHILEGSVGQGYESFERVFTIMHSQRSGRVLEAGYFDSVLHCDVFGPEIHPLAIHICLIIFFFSFSVGKCDGASYLVAFSLSRVAGTLPRLVHNGEASCFCGGFFPINEALRSMAPLLQSSIQTTSVLGEPFAQPTPRILFTT